MSYSVGDRVRIIPELRLDMTSQVGIMPEMIELADQIAKITRVTCGGWYEINLDGGRFSWEDFMFEPVTTPRPVYAVGERVRINDHLRAGNAYSVYVNDIMEGFAGQLTRILSIRNTGSYLRCGLDIDNDSWTWTDEMFSKIERTEFVAGMKCSNCGDGFDEESEIFHGTEGELICEACFNDTYFYCDRCGRVEELDRSHSMDDEIICSRCYDRYYTTCAECGEEIRRNGAVQVDEGYVCSTCYDEEYAECENCGNVYRRDDMTWDEDNCEWFCDRCEDARVIGGYHHTEAKSFFKLDHEHTEKFFGFELEVEARHGDKNTGAKNVLTAMGKKFIECKYDGSLCNGFEIASQPATKAYLDGMDFETALQGLVSDGMRSHDPKSCGLHFHVSRSFFDTDTEGQYQNIAKMIVMLNYIWEDVVKFSRRNYSDLEQWAKKNDSCDNVPEDILERNRYDRYQAINITNSPTIEFRFFRGTLRAKTFRASLEWVDLFTNYAVTHTLEECFTAHWNDIFEGASDNFKEYSADRGITGTIEPDYDSNN